ncbi:MCE family protein [Mycobacterium sp. OTB74]|uniref:MCE family protein n=1 Tax=Mycobacterium sp. OTB74 TaxID=1853452 RepID=UPI0024739C32|nr:MCE family protein [Mycobacterium sp. OTB74]MDH6246474.1 phospholipid/cholesterol/gamma-HCH transport system substrate-binding protein [Mycobacterium sp. OTB74]
MTIITAARQLGVLSAATALVSTGCAFQGLNSVPLPGVVGSGSDSLTYHVEIANVATLESNSPVMINNVVVGSIGPMRVVGKHADVQISMRPDAVVPANAVARIGQTSLLGSMHLELGPPVGEPARGRLLPGATLALNRNSTYPSTEETLSALSTVINAGGLGHTGDIIHAAAAALAGHQNEFRDVLERLNRFVGVINDQRDQIVASIGAINRLSSQLAAQRPAIEAALRDIPPALDVLIKERPRLISALDKLRELSNTSTALVNDSKDDLVKNLQNAAPTLQALADVGPDLDLLLGYLPTFPFTQNFLDRALRGDYFNVFALADLTVPRLKRTIFLGTRWGDPNAVEVPAPGDPDYLQYTHNPLTTPVAPATPAAPDGPVFAGPYPAPTPTPGAH